MMPVRSPHLVAFAESEVFARLFREGMGLVEEAAAYLDGPGRDDAKRLQPDAALVYATQSMKLTTRLMQVASWLLTQKGLREGDLSEREAAEAKYRLRDEAPVSGGLSFADIARHAQHLPATLLDLLARSDALYKRAARLDRSLYAGARGGEDAAAQLSRLRAAFAG